MCKADEYRDNALKSYDLAHKASTSADKGRLLRLTEKWLDLAERAHRLTGRPKPRIAEHPLVTRLLGREQPQME